MIRIGTAGWVYKDWEGIVYPKPQPRGFEALRYLADYFDTVEINSSFYGAPRASATKKWLESVAGNGEFKFTAKLYRSFTHERKPAPNDEKDFKDGMAPIVEAGRLGALLLQFPWSFKSSPENREYLIGLRNRFAEYPLVIEVRHRSWIEDDILDLFAELGIGICNIDQPLFNRSVKPRRSRHFENRVHSIARSQLQAVVLSHSRCSGALRPSVFAGRIGSVGRSSKTGCWRDDGHLRHEQQPQFRQGGG